MTITETRPLHPLRRPLVITGLLLVVLLVVAGIGFVALQGQIQDFSYTTTVSAGSDVRISGDNADVNLRPSVDGRVHVRAHGQYRRSQPRVSARQVSNGVVVDESCDGSGQFELCNISVDVDLPADNTVTVTGTNGSLDARSLTGNLSLATTNGDITAGGLRSATLSAVSENGNVSLNFGTSPTKIDARTTNGGITVTVPGTASYEVHPTTTNGRITVSVPNGDSPDHVITAITENGNITVRGT